MHAMKPTTSELRFILCASLCAILGTGCGGADSTPTVTVPEPLAAATVGVGGGELDGGDIVLFVPPDALTQDTGLAIHEEGTEHPFGETGTVYRIEGLPADLDAPLTLRIRTLDAGTKAAGPLLFLGETRDSRPAGPTGTWFNVAARDSADWCLARIDRGPYVLDETSAKALPRDFKVTVATGIGTATNETPGHFRVVYDETEITADTANGILAVFDVVYDELFQAGFTFGDQDTIWPLDINIRLPEFSEIAEYITAPWAKGHINLDPGLDFAGPNFAKIVVHELFHNAQSYFDSRHPSEWYTVNSERTWLDEATAACLEASFDEDWIPTGIDLDNYLAPLAGIGGHPTLEDAPYGYGMSSFIDYLLAHQGDEQVLALYQAFALEGNAVDALLTVMDPALGTWCADFQKQLALHEIYAFDPIAWTWHQWDLTTIFFDGAVGSSATETLHVPDFGSDVWKTQLEGEATETSSLRVEVLSSSDAASLPLNLILYGRNENELPVVLDEGVDEVVYDDWYTAHQTYLELMVQVVRPHGTGPGYDSLTDVELKVSVVEEAAGMPDYQRAKFLMTYEALLGDGSTVPMDVLATQYAHGTMSGNTFSAVWDTTNAQNIQLSGSLDVSLALNPLRVLNWSYEWRWTYPDPDSYKVYQVSGGGVPHNYDGATYTLFRLEDEAVCASATHVYFIEVMGGTLQTELDDWSCNASSYLNLYLSTADE